MDGCAVVVRPSKADAAPDVWSTLICTSVRLQLGQFDVVYCTAACLPSRWSQCAAFWIPLKSMPPFKSSSTLSTPLRSRWFFSINVSSASSGSNSISSSWSSSSASPEEPSGPENKKQEKSTNFVFWLIDSINQSINQSIDRWIDQSINQSINQSIDESINRKESFLYVTYFLVFL